MIPQSEYIAENIVILALQNNMGNVGLAAAELGLTRGELTSYLTRHPLVLTENQKIREASKNLVKDLAEDLLVEKMQSDNALLMFYLKTQAKDRGYDTGKNSTVNNTVEVNVDARSLIAAMRSGAKVVNEEAILEEGEFFQLSDLLPHGDGS